MLNPAKDVTQNYRPISSAHFSHLYEHTLEGRPFIWISVPAGCHKIDERFSAGDVCGQALQAGVRTQTTQHAEHDLNAIGHL